MEVDRGRRSWTVALLLVGLGLSLTALQFATERERVTATEIRNPEGRAGRALIVYHPGLSDVLATLTATFADTLEQQGWRVERTTTSRAAPTELAPYDLLVLGVHTYWWAPDGPTRRYLSRLSDLSGQPTAVLLVGSGDTRRAARVMSERVSAAHGRLELLLPLWTLRPNTEDTRAYRASDNLALAQGKVRQGALEVAAKFR